MSSRSFGARTNAGICPLCQRPILRGEDTFYLTCSGTSASPAAQVERSTPDNDTGYKVVVDWREPLYHEDGAPLRDRRGRQVFKNHFKWVRKGADGLWTDMLVWDHMVHTACAARLGYRTPGSRTSALWGKRVEGHGMAAGRTESPLEAIGRALDPEGPRPEIEAGEGEGESPSAPPAPAGPTPFVPTRGGPEGFVM